MCVLPISDIPLERCVVAAMYIVKTIVPAPPWYIQVSSSYIPDASSESPASPRCHWGFLQVRRLAIFKKFLQRNLVKWAWNRWYLEWRDSRDLMRRAIGTAQCRWLSRTPENLSAVLDESLALALAAHCTGLSVVCLCSLPQLRPDVQSHEGMGVLEAAPG